MVLGGRGFGKGGSGVHRGAPGLWSQAFLAESDFEPSELDRALAAVRLGSLRRLYWSRQLCKPRRLLVFGVDDQLNTME